MDSEIEVQDGQEAGQDLAFAKAGETSVTKGDQASQAEPRTYSEDEWNGVTQKVETLTKQYSDSRVGEGRLTKENKSLTAENESIRAQRDKFIDESGEGDEKFKLANQMVKDDRKRLMDWEADLKKREQDFEENSADIKESRFENNVRKVAGDEYDVDTLLDMAKTFGATTIEGIEKCLKFCAPKADKTETLVKPTETQARPGVRPGGNLSEQTLQDELDAAKKRR